MHEIQSALDSLLPQSVDVVDVCAVGGGCISDACCVAIDEQNGDAKSERRLFVKSNVASFLQNFQCEAEGLTQLGNAAAVRVPQAVAVGLAVGKSWLVMDWVDEGPRDESFFSKFGLQLAKLHRETRGEEIGWHCDNYLGSARQLNEPRSSWPGFFASQRIDFQLRWAIDQGHSDASLNRDCTQIVRNIDDLLSGREEYTSLLHGDLWSGNYLCDQVGEPVLIDPAVHRGCREAEFGMLNLFGACPDSFYQSYQNAWPMPDGWERRVSVYVLYHLLNHLNLFGGGYLSQCKSVAAEVLRA